MAAHPGRVWRGGALAFLLTAAALAAGTVLTAGPDSPAAQPPAPAQPSPPALPALPSGAVTAPAPPLPSPDFGPPPVPATPVAPPQPAATVDDPGDVVEPVVTIHRFPGRFLHATADRVTFLGAEPDGTPVVVSRSLDRPRPPLLDDDAFRTPVPAGDAKWCVDHVVVAGIREVVAVNPDGKVEWRFTLPGKPDARESLVGVVGVDGAKVLVASQFTPAVGDRDERPFGRVFWFDRADGRLTDCVTYPGGFGAARPVLDVPAKSLYAVQGGVVCYDLGTGQTRWSQPSPHGPVGHPAVFADGVIFAHSHVEVATSTRRERIGHNVTLTAPVETWEGTVYAGLKGANRSVQFVAFPTSGSRQVWSRNLPAEVAATPVVTGASVYAVAGRVLYRFDRKTGATCWKKTLPLNEGEAVSGLAQAGGELWVSGNGFFVRVGNEPEPTKPTPPPAKGELPGPAVPFAPPIPAPDG